jgi:hypothetical protein
MKESKYPKSTFSCLYNGTIILKIAKWTVGKKELHLPCVKSKNLPCLTHLPVETTICITTTRVHTTTE